MRIQRESCDMEIISDNQFSTSLVTSKDELEAIYAIRVEVFVEEQAVPIEEELDAYDLTAQHFVIRTAQKPADDCNSILGTARLIDKGDKTGKIGRVAVVKQYRGKGAGACLMRYIEVFAKERGFQKLILDAQFYAIPFYEKLGYIAEGGIFLDANIEHRFMKKSL